MPEFIESREEVFFKWLPEYNVQIESVDNQHRELVNIINRLFVMVFIRESDKTISETLDRLIRFTETHFELEERLMQQAKYPDFKAHKLEHRILMEELDGLGMKYRGEKHPTYFEMLSALKRWLGRHIQVDTRYKIALQQAGI